MAVHREMVLSRVARAVSKAKSGISGHHIGAAWRYVLAEQDT